MRYTYEEVKEKVESVGCELLTTKDNYTNTSNLFVKLPCGCDSKKRLPNLMQGARCPKHSRGRKPVSYEVIKQRAEGCGLALLTPESDFTNTAQSLKVTFSCGHEGEITYYTMKPGKKCYICAGYKIDKEDALKNVHDRGYKLLGEYKGTNCKYDMICPEGHEITLELRQFRKGNGCSYCSGSKGEKMVDYVLRKLINTGMDMTFTREYQIKTYHGRRYFDFAVRYRDKLFLIEFHGKQHFEHIEYFGGMKEFTNAQSRDLDKIHWTVQHPDTDLLVIPDVYDYAYIEDRILELLTSKVSPINRCIVEEMSDEDYSLYTK